MGLCVWYWIISLSVFLKTEKLLGGDNLHPSLMGPFISLDAIASWKIITPSLREQQGLQHRNYLILH